MEDDDIEYDITFPSPVSALDEDEDVAEAGYIERKEPVVILLGWLGCQEKHISKYSQIYDQRGCITISYTAPKNVAFFNHWKLRDIACKVLDLLEDYYVQDNPILFHIFSNNGSYVYHSLVQVLAGGDKRYQNLQVRGVIIDSAPGKARLLRAAQAYASSLQVIGLRKYLLMFGMIAFLILSRIKAWFFSLMSSKYQETNEHFLFENMANEQARWPELFLYSKADKIVSYHDIDDMIAKRKSMGVHVDSVCWEDSAHVTHLRQYPDDYRTACWEFLDFCLGVGLATDDMQETSEEEEYLLVNKSK